MRTARVGEVMRANRRASCAGGWRRLDMKVAIIGAGYVGCVTSACLARLGHDVLVVDIDEFKVGELAAGRDRKSVV